MFLGFIVFLLFIISSHHSSALEEREIFSFSVRGCFAALCCFCGSGKGLFILILSLSSCDFNRSLSLYFFVPSVTFSVGARVAICREGKTDKADSGVKSCLRLNFMCCVLRTLTHYSVNCLSKLNPLLRGHLIVPTLQINDLFL